MKANLLNPPVPADQVSGPLTEPRSGPAAPVSVLHGDRINILIVDDESKNLTVLETVLDDPGYRLVRAESANQALLALVAEEFALLILDIRMPDMSGFELAQMIKERKKTALVPIIFLTAYYNEDQHVLEGYSTGAVDYLHKPVNPVILRSKVAIFAALHRMKRECTKVNHALLAEVGERRRAEVQLRELAQRLVQAQEAERGRVANDLRVNITQLLYVILGRCEVLCERLSPGDGSLAGDTMKINEMIRTTTAEVEHIWRSLWSIELEKLGLAPALERAGEEFGRRTGLSIRTDCSGLTERPPVQTELALYRIFQKALDNVEQHARARHVKVQLTQSGSFVHLTITDDGIGFQPDHQGSGRARRDGVALFGMNERAVSVAGVLTVESSSGAGTKIEVRVPLPRTPLH